MYLITTTKDNHLFAQVELQRQTESLQKHKEYYTAKSIRCPYTHFAFVNEIYVALGDFSSCEIENVSYKVTVDKNIDTRIIYQWFFSHVQARVNLQNPDVEYFVTTYNKKMSVFKKIYTNKKLYLARNHAKRAFLHPSGIKAKYARAMVCATGLVKGTIHDPFCGAGGILIEALDMGFTVIGSDIDNRQLALAEKNCLDEVHKKPTLLELDALTQQQECDAVVTDMPFGKSTKSQDVQQLFTTFLQNTTAPIIVIGTPDFITVPSDQTFTAKITQYLHKSLKRIIYVLDKRREAV